LPEVKIVFNNLSPGQIATTSDIVDFDVLAGNGLLLDTTTAEGWMFWGQLDAAGDAFSNFIFVVASKVTTDPTQFGKMIVYMPNLWIDGNGGCDTPACTRSTIASLDAFSSGGQNLLTVSGGSVPEPGTILVLVAGLALLLLMGAPGRQPARILHR
jgi:hypothetical protein